MQKPVILVIFGGKSSEYEVSLASACSVLEKTDKEKYEIVKIGISKDGKWYLYEGETSDILNDSWQEKAKAIELDINNGYLVVGEEKIKPDKILPVLHGEYGEDGRIQALFELMDLSYVGCDSFCSFSSMDKDITKKIAKDIGVKVAKGITLYKNDMGKQESKKRIKKIGYPVVVKPTNGGSSVGVSIVKNECEIDIALKKAFEFSKKVLVEEKIDGKEIELAIIEKNGKPYFSTLGELSYTGEFYDYNEKYKNGKTEYIIPAKISKKSEKKIRKYARDLYYALGIKNLSRMDFFVKKNAEVYFNEVNTMPGFTEISMFPKLLINDGISYSDIINYILNI